MGSIMSHDEGLGGKVDWPRKRTFIQEKVSQQDTKVMKRETLKKVMTAKKEPVRTNQDNNTSQIF